MSGVLDALLESPQLEESTTSRERWAKWDATHRAVKALEVGGSHRVDGSFSIHRVAASGERQYRVTMKGPRIGPNAGDSHVHMASPRGATRAALGYSDRSGDLRQMPEADLLAAHADMRRRAHSLKGYDKTRHDALSNEIQRRKISYKVKPMKPHEYARESSIAVLIDPLTEAADSLAKASTPEPFSTSRTSNWVARAGGLPAYIQHIAHDLMEKRGKSESNAIQMAIGIVKNWASGKGKVDANTRAAAAKAVAEWEAMKGRNAAKGAARAAVQHSELSVAERLGMADDAELRLLTIVEATGVEGIRSLLVEVESGPLKLKCPKCGTVQAASNKSCNKCGHNLADARKAKMAKLNEAAATPSIELKRTASSNSESLRHEVHMDGQHVGYVAQRRGYAAGGDRPMRHTAYAINGDSVSSDETSQKAAIDTLKRHLEEAPARVTTGPGGKFLVAKAPSYGGQQTYTEYPGEESARHAAGLPPKRTSLEKASAVKALGEACSADLALIQEFAPQRFTELWGPMLRGRTEGDRTRPFRRDLAEGVEALAELFGPGATTTSRERWKRWEAEHGWRKHNAVSHLLHRVTTDPRLPVRSRSSHDPGRFRGRRLSEPEMIAQTEHGIWSHSAVHAAEGIAKGIIPSTEHAHRHQNADGSFGSFSHERTQLHAAIFKALLQGAGSHHGTAELHVMAGGPASGKTRLLGSGKVKIPRDIVTINPDLVREMLPEYRALKAQGFKGASNAVHEEASMIAKKALNIALGQKMHIVNDVVGNSEPGKFAKALKNGIAAGHKVHVHYAHVSTDLAAKRAADRAARTGRHVPEGYLRAAHTAVAQRFHEEVQHLPVHVTIHDTTGRAKLIARKGPRSGVMIQHRKGYASFLAKGGIRVGS